MEERTRLYPNFDLLRLFLALEVVASHVWLTAQRPGTPWLPIAPVSEFICLSGFLIPASFVRSKDKMGRTWAAVGDFARKRFLRTIPAIPVLLLFIAVFLGYAAMRDTLLNYFTAGYVGSANVGALWSLGIEDALYVSMVMLYVAGAYKRAWSLWLLFGASEILFYSLTGLDQYRFWGTIAPFFAGSLLWRYQDKLKGLPLWATVAVLAIPFLIGIPGLPGLPHLLSPVIGAPLKGTALILLLMKVPQLKMRLPDLSYGTYIWHGPILYALYPQIGTGWQLAACGVPMTLVAAAASWYLIESPALKLKNAPLQLPWKVARTGQPVAETA